uniref:Uncharacterized protein n=1 Tax=Rhizophora mucronata TaxID=61149 RepID=A0A2P2JWA8_RHIMU
MCYEKVLLYWFCENLVSSLSLGGFGFRPIDLSFGGNV